LELTYYLQKDDVCKSNLFTIGVLCVWSDGIVK